MARDETCFDLKIGLQGVQNTSQTFEPIFSSFSLIGIFYPVLSNGNKTN